MPLSVPDDIKLRYPNLANVLQQVAAKKEKDLQFDKSEHEEEKKRWLKYETIYQSILQIIKMKWEGILKGNLTPQQSEFWKSYEKVFLSSAFLSSSEFNETILGVNRKSVKNFSAHEQESWDNKFKDEVESSLSEYLVKICMKLTEYYDGIDYTHQEKMCRSRAVHLHEIIQNERDNLCEKTEEVKEAEEEIVNNFISNMQILMICSELLEKMMAKYQLKLQKKKDETEIKKLHNNVQMIAMKAKSVRLNLMTETYSKEDVICLRNIRRVLTEKIDIITVEMRSTEEKLKTYKSMGCDFQEIVDEYCKTVEEINKQKWVLKEVDKQTKKTDPYLC